jgi:hypothetical protein
LENCFLILIILFKQYVLYVPNPAKAIPTGPFAMYNQCSVPITFISHELFVQRLLSTANKTWH